MKRTIGMLLLCSLVFLSGCSTEAAEETTEAVDETTDVAEETKEAAEETEIYMIPESYFEFSSTEAADQAEASNELGDELCTNAEAVGTGMKLELTDVQRDNMIKRNDEFAESLVDDLLQENEAYHYTGDDSYRKLDFYFDEHVDPMTQIFALQGACCCYAYNQILLNHTEDWNVELTIYNCHTNKVVVHANIPSEDSSWTPEDWENSY